MKEKYELFICSLSTYIISPKHFKILNENRVNKAHTWNSAINKISILWHLWPK